jgi:hypothetical protein
MKIGLNRDRKLILLQWLRQGYIETLDLPEAYKDHSYFEELMKSAEDSLPILSDEDIEEIKKINKERTMI